MLMFFALLFYKKVGKIFLRAFFLKKAEKDFQILKANPYIKNKHIEQKELKYPKS